MSHTSFTFLLEHVREECRQQIIDDPRILKMTAGSAEGVIHVTEITGPGPELIFTAALDNQTSNPVPAESVKSFQIAQDHPEFGWLLLHMAWQSDRFDAK